MVRTYQKCSESLTNGIKPLGIKLAQHDVLINLLLLPGQTQQQLAQHSFVTKSHMSAVLAEMEEAGLLTRQSNVDDKRSKVIALTATGLSLAQQAFSVQEKVVAMMLAPLTDKQVDELEKMSRSAARALGQALEN